MPTNFDLNTNEYLQQCDSKDVISFNSEKWVGVSKIKEIVHQVFTIYKTPINKDISNNSGTKDIFCLFDQGEECEILRAGSKGWQRERSK